MFHLINPSHKKLLDKLINGIPENSISNIHKDIQDLIATIKDDIPEKKRISYGRYSIIKQLGLTLYPLLKQAQCEIFTISLEIFKNIRHDPFVRSLAVQLISISGLESNALTKALTLFETAAKDEQWEVRECSAGFIRKLIRKNPKKLKKWYLTQATSQNPLSRRFASESLRPVADNVWFKNNPEFSFSILTLLFKESKPYPRTSVGNNLSDWARIDKERIYTLVEKLVKSRDKNSYWIAYRACRNLIKKEPIRVMDLLKVDEYKYKQKIYFRKDYL